MKTTLDYLNAAKTALGIESDYGMAKWLGVTKQTVSGYKSGSRIIDDYAAARIAEALGKEAIEVIAVANMEREKVSERKEFWRKVASRVLAILIAIFLVYQDVDTNIAVASELTEVSKYRTKSAARRESQSIGQRDSGRWRERNRGHGGRWI
jgi:predicted transcriptional regulator